MLAPNSTCVSVMVDSRRAQGAAMTGCGAFSISSPRCAASCCTHHWQIFLNVKGGSCRPHRIQFAMLVKEYQQRVKLWKGTITIKHTKLHEGRFPSWPLVSFVVNEWSSSYATCNP